MLIYILPVIVLFCSYIDKRLRYSYKWELFVVSYLCIFLCFGYMTGSDWRQYESMYDFLDFRFLFLEYAIEPGYYFYMMIYKFIGFSFWPFFIITKILCFFVIYRIIQHYSGEYKYAVLTFFVPSFGYFLFIDNPMRNLIAVSIFLLSIRYIFRRQFLRYLIVIGIACSFHYTAFITIPLYFFVNRRIPNILLIMLYFISYVFVFKPDLLFSFLGGTLGDFLYIQEKLEAYGNRDEGEGKILSINTLINIIMFFFIIIRKKYISRIQSGNFIFNMSFLYFFTSSLSFGMLVFSRFQLYFAVFICVLIGLLIGSFKGDIKGIYLASILGLSLMYCNNIKTSYKYVPYSNIIPYAIEGNYPSFSQRSDYNLKYSPYK